MKGRRKEGMKRGGRESRGKREERYQGREKGGTGRNKGMKE